MRESQSMFSQVVSTGSYFEQFCRSCLNLPQPSSYIVSTFFVCHIVILRSRVRIEVRPTENDSTRLYKNGDISVVITCS